MVSRCSSPRIRLLFPSTSIFIAAASSSLPWWPSVLLFAPPFHRCFRFSRTILQNVIKDLERGVVCGVLFFSCCVKLLQGCHVVWAIGLPRGRLLPARVSPLAFGFPPAWATPTSLLRIVGIVGVCGGLFLRAIRTCIVAARMGLVWMRASRGSMAPQFHYSVGIMSKYISSSIKGINLYHVQIQSAKRLNVVLDGQMHFISHAAQKHNTDIFRKCK